MLVTVVLKGMRKSYYDTPKNCMHLQTSIVECKVSPFQMRIVSIAHTVVTRTSWSGEQHGFTERRTTVLISQKLRNTTTSLEWMDRWVNKKICSYKSCVSKKGSRPTLPASQFRQTKWFYQGNLPFVFLLLIAHMRVDSAAIERRSSLIVTSCYGKTSHTNLKDLMKQFSLHKS